MKRIAILGCENSHADAFLTSILIEKKYTDIEVVGVYTNEPEAEERMKKNFGVYCAKSYDEFVGRVDGIMITARDGVNHYKYAKPYIAMGIPMFIDKPITSDNGEAVEFMKELKANGCRVCGGSSCACTPHVLSLSDTVAGIPKEDIYGGFLRAPVSMNNIYGGFYFYAQHLAEVLLKIFGYYPKSVKAYTNANVTSIVVRYDEYDILAEYVDGNYMYYAYASTKEGLIGGEYPVNSSIYEHELQNFYSLLSGGEQKISYRDFIAPVFLISAIKKSIDTGAEVELERIGEI